MNDLDGNTFSIIMNSIFMLFCFLPYFLDYGVHECEIGKGFGHFTVTIQDVSNPSSAHYLAMFKSPIYLIFLDNFSRFVDGGHKGKT